VTISFTVRIGVGRLLAVTIQSLHLYRNPADGTKASTQIPAGGQNIGAGLDVVPVSLSITRCNKVAYFDTGAGDGSR